MTIDRRDVVQHRLGFYIIKPESVSNHIPLDCPVCKMMMRDQSDVLSYDMFECCNECKLTWAQANHDKWVEGWRPSDEIIQEETKKRRSLPVYQVS